MTDELATAVVADQLNNPPISRLLGGVSPKQPSEIRADKGLVAVCMAASGAGKTTLTETLLDSDLCWPVCHLAVDNGSHVLTDVPGKRAVYQATTWEQLKKYVEDLIKDSDPFKTIVFDGLSWGQKLTHRYHNIQKIPVTDARARQGAYGKANDDYIALIGDLNIIAERGINIIYNSWADTREFGAIKKMDMDLTTSLVSTMRGMIDFVVYLELAAENKPYPPVMITGGNIDIATSTRVAPNSPLKQLPNRIWQPSWASIIEAFHGKPWNVEKHVKAGSS